MLTGDQDGAHRQTAIPSPRLTSYIEEPAGASRVVSPSPNNDQRFHERPTTTYVLKGFWHKTCQSNGMKGAGTRHTASVRVSMTAMDISPNTSPRKKGRALV